jgi:outer membrane protein TolC
MGQIRIFILIGLFCAPALVFAQNPQNRKPTVFAPPLVIPDTGKKITVGAKDTDINHTSSFLSLRQCIDYAMEHQPALNRALINVDITRETNGVNLAGWLPQVTGSGSLVHYFQQPSGGTVSTPGTTTTTTTTSRVSNSFVPQVAVSQALFSPTLFYYHRTAPLLVEQAKQATDSSKINLVSSVTKQFYAVLLTLEQINILKEDTTRLGKNVRDTYHQYIGGIVDETDFEEATITLNNSKAQLKQANENVTPQFANLKALMGYPPEQPFNLTFDTTQMFQAIHIDTAQQLQYEKRIEFQELKTQKNLQNELIHYYRFQWVPTVSAFFNYDLSFQNSNYANLLSTSYPTSYAGLSVSIPIFTGFARLHNEKKAQLQYRQLDWDQVDLKANIYSQYTSALANYKSNYYNLQLLQQNVTLARRTYFVVDLQYRSGIVPYLNVITAESNLITSEVNYLNALFQVLTNKVDLQKAMGLITY